MKVAVIGGGYSSEAEVSLRSVETVFANFDNEIHEPYKVILLPDEWYVEIEGGKTPIDRADFSFIKGNEKITFDYAFIVIHGTPGEDGKLQSYFDLIGIPYNTCNAPVSALTFDKWYTISMIKNLGYPCAKSILLRSIEQLQSLQIKEELGFPIFVKPCDGGSSYGVSRVENSSQLLEATKLALVHGTTVLLEAEIKGLEVTCGVYTSPKGIEILEITEVIPENDFFDYEAKYKGKSEEITPARLSKNVADLVKQYTKSIYQDLGMKGMARIDFIIIDDVPNVLEINTTPGMTEASFIPQQVKYCGKTLKQFFNEIIACS